MIRNKKYLLIYTALLVFFSIWFLVPNNFQNVELAVGLFIVLLIIGIVSISYYSFNENSLHKVAFVIILLFGIAFVFVSPINDISDEVEHTVRSEILSEGDLQPDYVLIPNTDVYNYKTINSIVDLAELRGVNVLSTDVDNSKIDYGDNYFNSAFAQNPFYAYLAPAIGMIVAKLLDLNAIWLLWMGRIFNLLLYSAVVAIAIKKAPVFKFPLMIVGIIPLAIYQGASTSADCFFNAFAILALAYFFVLFKSERIRYLDLGIFYGSIILCGLLKPPYLALALLIFLVPKVNFKNSKQNILSKIAIIAVLLVGIGWSSYSTAHIHNSWRADYFLANNVNSTQQLSFVLANPLFDVWYFFDTFLNIPTITYRLFNFSNGPLSYYSSLLTYLYSIFFVVLALFYPIREKISKLNRIKASAIAIIIYVGVFFVQYLTWVPVGSAKIVSGVMGRYFIPLLVFLPFIFNLNSDRFEKERFKTLYVTLAVSFIAAVLMLTLSVKYSMIA